MKRMAVISNMKKKNSEIAIDPAVINPPSTWDKKTVYKRIYLKV